MSSPTLPTLPTDEARSEALIGRLKQRAAASSQKIDKKPNLAGLIELPRQFTLHIHPTLQHPRAQPFHANKHG
jgi:hypothetical protein